jgi:hypothetical protein
VQALVRSPPWWHSDRLNFLGRRLGANQVLQIQLFEVRYVHDGVPTETDQTKAYPTTQKPPTSKKGNGDIENTEPKSKPFRSIRAAPVCQSHRSVPLAACDFSRPKRVQFGRSPAAIQWQGCQKRARLGNDPGCSDKNLTRIALSNGPLLATLLCQPPRCHTIGTWDRRIRRPPGGPPRTLRRRSRGLRGPPGCFEYVRKVRSPARPAQTQVFPKKQRRGYIMWPDSWSFRRQACSSPAPSQSAP